MKQACCRFLLTVSLLLSFSAATHSQNAFQNLGFESAVILPVPGDPFGRVEFSAALPGWAGYIGIVPQSLVLFNDLFIGSPGIGVVGRSRGAIEGNYSLVLQGGSEVSAFHPSIVQSGVIPDGTRSIQFKSLATRNVFSIEMGGQTLDTTIISTESGYNIYGCDVSQFASQNVELKITSISGLPGSGNLYLDSIFFSASPVPEPSTWALFGLAALSLAWRFKRMWR